VVLGLFKTEYISTKQKKKARTVFAREVEFVTAPVLPQAGGVQCRDAGAGGNRPSPVLSKGDNGCGGAFS